MRQVREGRGQAGPALSALGAAPPTQQPHGQQGHLAVQRGTLAGEGRAVEPGPMKRGCGPEVPTLRIMWAAACQPRVPMCLLKEMLRCVADS